jgi:hypothetical protein
LGCEEVTTGDGAVVSVKLLKSVGMASGPVEGKEGEEKEPSADTGGVKVEAGGCSGGVGTEAGSGEEDQEGAGEIEGSLVGGGEAGSTVWDWVGVPVPGVGVEGEFELGKLLLFGSMAATLL